MTDLDETAAVVPGTPAPEQPSAYQIRVRKSDSPKSWTTLSGHFEVGEFEAAAAQAAAIATHVVADLRPAEVLLVDEHVPLVRWLDGEMVNPESLAPGHPGGCHCGECCIRWAHLDGRPSHEPCTHGACRLCGTCHNCDWDDAQQQLQDFAATNLTEAGDAIDQALTRVADAGEALRRLEREERHAEFSIDLLEPRGVEALMDKLNRACEKLQDADRILECYQLRTELAATGRLPR